jgi:hypothetical protein
VQVDLATSEGSVVGNSLPSLTYNSGPPSWFTVSTSTYNSWVINGNNGGTDNTLEPPNNSNSPEDTNLNAKLDNFGPQNLGLGFYGTTGGASNDANTDINNTAAPNPYVRMTSCTTAGKNWVSGARRPETGGWCWGTCPPPGFTVGSENPVYVFGNYNTAPGGPTWGSPSSEASPDVHSAAGLVAYAISCSPITGPTT